MQLTIVQWGSDAPSRIGADMGLRQFLRQKNGPLGDAAQKVKSLLGKGEANGRNLNAIKGHLFRGFSKTECATRGSVTAFGPGNLKLCRLGSVPDATKRDH